VIVARQFQIQRRKKNSSLETFGKKKEADPGRNILRQEKKGGGDGKKARGGGKIKRRLVQVGERGGERAALPMKMKGGVKKSGGSMEKGGRGGCYTHNTPTTCMM